MTITLVLPQPPAYSETFFRSKIKGLQKSGHTVILVTANTSQQFKACEHLQHPKLSKNPILQIFRMIFVFLGLIPYLRRIIRYVQLEKTEGTSFKRSLEKLYFNATLLKLNTDWLHFGFATMAIEREFVAKAIGAKLAVSFRGYDIGVYPLKHHNAYQKLWKFVDKVHSISDDLYAKALKNGLKESVSVQKITPAIDTEFFKIEQETIDFQESKKYTFLSMGRLHWKKGFVDTLKALSILKERNFDFRYRIVGEGKEYERIAYAAYQLGFKEQVVFLGKLHHDEVKVELNNADLYIQYSIQEGFCNAVLEAQALGKLCVVSDAEGLAENVLHNQTGWVVPKLQPQKLAKQMMAIMEMHKTKKKEISQNAMQRVKKDFNLEKQNREFNAFYENL